MGVPPRRRPRPASRCAAGDGALPGGQGGGDMISVTVVGGPDDGIEVVVEGDRVHMAYPDELPWQLNMTEETGTSIHEVIMPVRLTRNGYRCYWSERAR